MISALLLLLVASFIAYLVLYAAPTVVLNACRAFVRMPRRPRRWLMLLGAVMACAYARDVPAVVVLLIPALVATLALMGAAIVAECKTLPAQWATARLQLRHAAADVAQFVKGL